MAMLGLGRRFVNIVTAGKYKTGLLSVHRLDVSKHLFYPSASEARSASDDERTLPQQQELPAPCAIFSDATTAAAPARRRSTAFFSLVSPRSSSDGSCRILFTNEDGDCMMYDADEGCHATPCPGPALEGFAGPVAASVSVLAQQAGGVGAAAAKEESTYVVHGVRGEAAHFHVLRFGTPPYRRDGSTRVGDGWYWQSLPPPPFISDDRPYAIISSYTVVEGGRTICVSSHQAAATVGTWCFDTIRGEWWHAGDWEMPFDGRAEYLADLDLWLGFSSFASPGRELCTTSGLSQLSAMAKNQPPTLLQRVWQDGHTPMPKKVELISLGSGRFAIVKVFNLDHGYTSDFGFYDNDYYMGEDDELLDVTGIEICPRHESCGMWSCSDGLQLIPHKSISFICDTHRIHQVL